VPLQPGGRRTPFFCVAPAGAEVIGLTSLAHSLDQDQPFYGLQLPGPANARQPVSVSDMAARCLREMKSIQQDGPYLIGGTCMGGLVAYEMACQLHSQGKDVALLVLFDSSQPPPLISLREYIPRLLFHHLPRGQLFYCLKRDLAEKIRKLKRRFDRGPEAVRRYRVWKAHEQARRAYWPGTYPGRIILFQSLEFSIRFPEYVARWSALAAGGVNHHIIPATHRDQLDKECITLVAKQLKTYLQKLPAGER
jgi:thioesterase domain-containing protein